MAQQHDDLSRAARRAATIDGIPVVALGSIALALGSDPDQSAARTGWWLGTGIAFALAIAWVLFRSFRRADEYQRRIQLESMAIAFGAVLVGIHIAGLLDAAGIGNLRQHVQIVFIGGIVLWLTIADLRTRFVR